MSTTLIYQICCRACGNKAELSLDEIERDPQCAKCGAELGHLVRIEGFKRVDG